MSFFNQAVPILRSKGGALDMQNRPGVLRLQFKIRGQHPVYLSYTRIDQMFVVWGLISALIFITGQFSPISWTIQAVVWSILTVVGIVAMVILSHAWAKQERLIWVLYLWVILMLIGVTGTDLGIFLGWGAMLMHLSHLWLFLSALGYLASGYALRSRALILAGLAHLLTITILPYVGGWQFLTTGLLMAANLLFFAEMRWDMRPSVSSDNLPRIKKQKFITQPYQLIQSEY